jgi:hypothetical protein
LSYSTTVIEHLVKSSGKPKNWFATQLDYSIVKWISGFNLVLKGKRIPKAHRRVSLAKILRAKVNDLWTLDEETGELIARRIESVEASTKDGRKVSS